jgi:hypothetical protein
MESREERLAKNQRMRETRCRHFTGYQAGTCKAGRVYRDVVGGPEFGWAARLPCLPESGLRKEPMASCSSYDQKTAEEIAADDRDTEIRTECMIMAIGIIKAQEKPRGTIACPMCYSGELHFTKSTYNGHIWGQCKKHGCLSWMM